MVQGEELIPMVNWLYDLILWVLSILVDLFFREVHPRGAWRVPRRGPVLFVGAPHANQVRLFLSAPGVVTNRLPVRRPSNSYAHCAK